MSKPKIPNQRSNNIALKQRLNKYQKLVQSVFDALAKDAAGIATRTDYDADDGKPFSFAHYPLTKQAVDELQRKYVSEVGSIIMRGTSTEWQNSNLAQDALVDGLLKAYEVESNGKKYQRYYQTNSPQLKAFQQRKDKGMNLSDNLWNKSKDMTEEMEQCISAGIEKGMSAVTLSKRLSRYLNDFDELKADYKDRFGTAITCKNCEYASVRLARSEINMAYRKAEQLRWQQMDFVVGYEIKTTQNGHHASDMCDQLAGKYPKDFEWNGWHPNCMCYRIPILKNEDEFWSEDSDNSTESVNEIKEIPSNLTQWIADNKERIDIARDKGTLPYFIKDNEDVLFPKKKTPLEIAEERHSARTEDDVNAIRDAWKKNRAHNFATVRGILPDSDEYDEVTKFYIKHFDDDISEQIFQYTIKARHSDVNVADVYFSKAKNDIDKYIDKIIKDAGIDVDESLADDFRMQMRRALRSLKSNGKVVESIEKFDELRLDIDFSDVPKFNKLYEAYRNDLCYFAVKKQAGAEMVAKYEKKEVADAYIKATENIKKLNGKGLSTFEKIQYYDLACEKAKHEVSLFYYDRQREKVYAKMASDLSVSDLSIKSSKFASLTDEIQDLVDAKDWKTAFAKIEKANNLTSLNADYEALYNEYKALAKKLTADENVEVLDLLYDAKKNIEQCKEADSVIAVSDLRKEVETLKAAKAKTSVGFDGTRIVSSNLGDMEDDFAKEVEFFDNEFGDLSKQQYNNASTKAREGIRAYTGGDYIRMNRSILGLSTPDDYTKELINGCTEYLEQCEFGKSLVVRRGTTTNVFKSMFGLDVDSVSDADELKAMIGSISKPQCFFSCGATKNAGFDGSVEFYIHVKPDTKAAYVDRFSKHSTIGGLNKIVEDVDFTWCEEEFEVVIQQGYKYKIINVGYKDPTKRAGLFFELEISGKEVNITY